MVAYIVYPDDALAQQVWHGALSAHFGPHDGSSPSGAPEGAVASSVVQMARQLPATQSHFYLVGEMVEIPAWRKVLTRGARRNCSRHLSRDVIRCFRKLPVLLRRRFLRVPSTCLKPETKHSHYSERLGRMCFAQVFAGRQTTYVALHIQSTISCFLM